jgi:hypothetical protein
MSRCRSFSTAPPRNLLVRVVGEEQLADRATARIQRDPGGGVPQKSNRQFGLLRQ